MEETMVTNNAKLVMELDRQLAAALARMDEAAATALMADDLVWTHVNARVTENKEAVFEVSRSGDSFYTSIEPYDVTARDYGTFVVVTGSSRIDATYKGTRLLIDCRFTDVWGNIDGKWLMVVRHATNKTSE
jgi:ketosteroid isomerase-like protein